MTAGKNPLVSIVVRTKDRPEFLKTALKSIAAQTYRQIEVVLVNDGGSDLEVEELKGILSDISLNYVRLEDNAGRARAANIGIERARGEFIGFLDDDDRFYPEHVETLAVFLVQNGRDAAYTDSNFVTQEWITGRYVTVGKEVLYSQDFDRQRLLVSNYIPILNVIYRKDLIDKAGMFDEKLEAHEDWDLWLRLSQYTDFHHIKKTTAEVSLRNDGTTITSQKRRVFLESARIIHKRYLPFAEDEEIVKGQNGVEWSLAKEVVRKGEVLENAYLVDIAEKLLKGKDGHINNLEGAIRWKDGHIANLEAAVRGKDDHIAELRGQKDAQIANLGEVIKEKDVHVANLEAAIREKDTQIADLVKQKNALQSRLDAIFNSRGWKFLARYYRIRDILFPGRSGGGGTNSSSGEGAPEGAPPEGRIKTKPSGSEPGLKFSRLSRVRRALANVAGLCRAVPRAVSSCNGSLPLTFRRGLGVLKRGGVSGVMRRASILALDPDSGSRGDVTSVVLYGEVPPPDPKFRPKVSVILPNFNHEKYLPERLESIYGQTYDNVEVILLDDCSADESVTILSDYAARYPGRTVCGFNEVNSGGVFNQWKRGLELATGELVWIAESDDYCSLNLLEELVRFFQNPAVMLAFAPSDFMRGEPAEKVWTSDEYLSDLDLAIWDRPFIQSAHALVKNGWAVKNLVPNVSGAVFRNPGKMELFDDPEWIQARLCGDWMFYLSLIRGGLVAYSPNATNYYRQHPFNTSVNAQNENLYYQEFEKVARHLVRNYALEPSCLERQESHLYKHWCMRHGYSRQEEFRDLYNLDRVWPASSARKPNLVMAVFALTAGGGETFPIMLANLLHARGYAVTLLNCQMEPSEPWVRRMLSQGIPLLELARLDLMDAVFKDMAVELVHSHHASVDVTLSTLLMNYPDVGQIITLHGMYETMTPSHLNSLMPLLSRRPDCFVYTAEKNLESFSREFREEKKFYRIDNALPPLPITPVPRSKLNLGEDDFVLCLVSRAMPEKGWEEAIGAVAWANARSGRKIHLLLIGEGEEFERLRYRAGQDFVHFLGFRPNIRDYFAASDIGFLPSRFSGESFPLVLIDCLQAGRPFLASDVGEIRYMLGSDEGLAGELFTLEEWRIPVEKVGQIIHTLANNPEVYQRLLRRVPLAVAKFNTDLLVDKYEEVYRRCLVSKYNGLKDVPVRREGCRI